MAAATGGTIRIRAGVAALLVWLALALPAAAGDGVPGGYSLTGELRAGAGRLAGEAKDFAVTPFQLDNGNILLTLGVAGAIGLTYAYDTDIRDRLQAARSRKIDKAADAGALAGDPFLHLGLAAVVYGGGVWADSPRWKETGEMIGEALILADAATLLLKEAGGRGRPLATDHKGDFRPFDFRSNYDSLPSMHTASSFALAAVVARTAESAPLAFLSYGAATFVGFSRMNQNRHWASDVLLGAAIGELAGRVVTSYHARKSSYAVVPTALNSGGGLALVGRF